MINLDNYTPIYDSLDFVDEMDATAITEEFDKLRTRAIEEWNEQDPSREVLCSSLSGCVLNCDVRRLREAYKQYLLSCELGCVEMSVEPYDVSGYRVEMDETPFTFEVHGLTYKEYYYEEEYYEKMIFRCQNYRLGSREVTPQNQAIPSDISRRISSMGLRRPTAYIRTEPAIVSALVVGVCDPCTSVEIDEILHTTMLKCHAEIKLYGTMNEIHQDLRRIYMDRSILFMRK